ncbi:hypothetical protein KXS07_02505 [Inquilinus limosus]|uniref:aKG-HExxH-type peptide beta-hydroxylase n=1 Tax=Inquilinus limosus TaxID=171674 RepID=UPI003F18A1AF
MQSFPISQLSRFNQEISKSLSQRVVQKRAAILQLFGRQFEDQMLSNLSCLSGAALLDHLFYNCMKLAEGGKVEELEIVRNNLVNGRQPDQIPDFRSFISLKMQSCLHIADSAFSSPVYIYDFSRCPSFDKIAEVESAVDLIDRIGWSSLTNSAIGVVVTLNPRAFGEHLESYTVTALRCTVFLDYYVTPLRNAETLVHEAAHNWLNLAFDTFQEPLPETPTWWSPWRGVERPVAGMIHAVFAFGCVVGFLEAASKLGILDDTERTYVKRQILDQGRRMWLLQSKMPEILRYISTSEIRSIIEMLYNSTLEIASRFAKEDRDPSLVPIEQR